MLHGAPDGEQTTILYERDVTVTYSVSDGKLDGNFTEKYSNGNWFTHRMKNNEDVTLSCIQKV